MENQNEPQKKFIQRTIKNYDTRTIDIDKLLIDIEEAKKAGYTELTLETCTYHDRDEDDTYDHELQGFSIETDEEFKLRIDREYRAEQNRLRQLREQEDRNARAREQREKNFQETAKELGYRVEKIT